MQQHAWSPPGDRFMAYLPLSVVIQAKDQLHGDDDEGGSLQVIQRQGWVRMRVKRVECFTRHTSEFHQLADPGVELI